MHRSKKGKENEKPESPPKPPKSLIDLADEGEGYAGLAVKMKAMKRVSAARKLTSKGKIEKPSKITSKADSESTKLSAAKKSLIQNSPSDCDHNFVHNKSKNSAKQQSSPIIDLSSQDSGDLQERSVKHSGSFEDGSPKAQSDCFQRGKSTPDMSSSKRRLQKRSDVQAKRSKVSGDIPLEAEISPKQQGDTKDNGLSGDAVFEDSKNQSDIADEKSEDAVPSVRERLEKLRNEMEALCEAQDSTPIQSEELQDKSPRNMLLNSKEKPLSHHNSPGTDVRFHDMDNESALNFDLDEECIILCSQSQKVEKDLKTNVEAKDTIVDSGAPTNLKETSTAMAHFPDGRGAVHLDDTNINRSQASGFRHSNHHIQTAVSPRPVIKDNSGAASLNTEVNHTFLMIFPPSEFGLRYFCYAA